MIYDITPFTLLDYPDTPACIFWFAGCNLRCAYCYNPHIVFGKSKINEEDAICFLKSRVNLLEGVVLSGGEATYCADIVNFATKIKKLGFKIKLDTNGSNPKVLKKLIDKSLLDYIAIDFKAPKSKFLKITNKDAFNSFLKSLKIINSSNIEYEIRTTYHSALLNEEDINNMLNIIRVRGYKKPFFVQNAINGVKTLQHLPDSKKFLKTDDQIVSR
ncbi:MAG: hypothetical protein RL154_593 [Pseudomonadota bacterium]